MRLGIEPLSSWILVRFINHWVTTGTPRGVFLIINHNCTIGVLEPLARTVVLATPTPTFKNYRKTHFIRIKKKGLKSNLDMNIWSFKRIKTTWKTSIYQSIYYLCIIYLSVYNHKAQKHYNLVIQKEWEEIHKKTELRQHTCKNYKTIKQLLTWIPSIIWLGFNRCTQLYTK